MMKRYIYWYLWFIRESDSFMAPKSKWNVTYEAVFKGMAHRYAMDMVRWSKMTPDQREAWYISGEGRTLYF